MELNVAYSKMHNAGDLFNEELLQWITGRNVVHSKIYSADMLAIGSGLNGLQLDKYYQLEHSFVNRTSLHIWGTGFLQEPPDKPFFKENIRIHALRGCLSQVALATILGKPIDVPLADPGLLISEFLCDLPPRQFDIGLVPHSYHSQNSSIKRLSENTRIHLIDITQKPIKVAEEISKCECILSSSLHGLVFSDSLGVPNLHILGGDGLIGGDYKFRDYYSAYGLPDIIYNPFCEGIDVERIISHYHINKTEVQRKKKQLLTSFPHELVDCSSIPE